MPNPRKLSRRGSTNASLKGGSQRLLRREPAKFTEPPKDNLKHHRLVWERTDVFTISNALQLDAVRRCPDHSLFDVLMSLFKRSVNVDQDGIGGFPCSAPRPHRAWAEGADLLRHRSGARTGGACQKAQRQ